MHLSAGRVLVVEDDHAICDLISDALGEADIVTVCAHSDREAYEAIPSLPTFLALIVDVNLGLGVTGYDVARFARQVIPGIAVIYLSGQSSPEQFEAFGVPDSDFVEKPFTTDGLLRALNLRLAA